MNWDSYWRKDKNGWFSDGPSARSRRRIIGKLIRKYGAKDSSILDVGCGTGELLLALYQNGFKNLWGADISETALNRAQLNCESCNFKILDIEKGKLDEKFDIVVSMATLELKSVRDDQSAINNMAKMLNNGGYLILALQHRKIYWSKLDDIYNLRRYETPELTEKCGKAGLKKVEMFSWGWPLYSMYYALMAGVQTGDSDAAAVKNGFLTRLASYLLYLLFFVDDLFMVFGKGRWLLAVFKN